MAMRKHQQASHPEEYNRELYEEAETGGRRQFWTEGELEEMARLEAAYEGEKLLDYLAEKMGRPKEGLRKKRYGMTYTNLVERFKNEIATTSSTSPTSDNECAGPSRPNTRSRVTPGRVAAVRARVETSDSETSSTSIEEETYIPEREDSEEEPTEYTYDPDNEQLPLRIVVDLEPDSQTTNAEPITAPHTPTSPNIWQPDIQSTAHHTPTTPGNIPIDTRDPVLNHLIQMCVDLEDVEAIQVCSAVCQRESGYKEVIDRWVLDICKKYGRVRKSGYRTAPQMPEETGGRRKYRARLYKYIQNKFKANKKELAREIIDDIKPSATKSRPKTDDIIEEYKSIFENASPPDIAYITDAMESPCNIYAAIEKTHIMESIKSMGTTSAGPDGIDSGRLKKIPLETLELLYNLMVHSKYVPEPLRKSRTILIPKNDKNKGNIDNWRPITVASILLRVLNKMMAKKLAANIQIDECQRGFTDIDGCFANNLTLQKIIKKKRKEGKPLTVITLDLKKAFDNISHQSIKRALRRFKVDPRTAAYIMANFEDQWTTIFCEGEEIAGMQVKRGVKQGDPLSPILFNMVLDELIASLKIRHGVKMGTANISVLGYADDLLLLAENTKDAQFLLKYACQFFEARSLALNTNKCTSLSLSVVPSKKKLYIHPTPKFYVRGNPIPPITSVAESFKYLGKVYTHTGMTPCSTANLDTQLTRIMRAPLKPQQKMTILAEHLVPRYIHSLQSPSINIRVLKQADRQIRRAVKKILRLPVHIIDESLYTPVRLGGLGIFSLTRKIPIIMMDRIVRVKRRCNLFSSAIGEDDAFTMRLQRMIKPHLKNKNAVDQNNADKLESSFYGGGTKQAANNSASNFYIYSPPPAWSGEDYLSAIKLRTNTLPTRGLPYGPREAKMCRGKCGRIESLSHMLQKCHLGHSKRINRHDFVLKRIAEAARRKGWEVTEEPHIRDTRGRLNKPDMVCSKGDIIIVADVGVSWETPRLLSETYMFKKATYDQPEFLDALSIQHPDKNISVLPFIIGARGFWCRESDTLLQALDIATTQLRRDLVMTTLRGSWSIHTDVCRRSWD